MKVLGISGGPHGPGNDPLHFPNIDGFWHDAAAVLLDDGEVVCAHEEERLSRSKHTCAFPHRSVAACMAQAGVGADQLDGIAVYFTEDYWTGFVEERLLYDPEAHLAPPRAQLATLLATSGLVGIDADRIHFVHHHTAHATAALRHSGFGEALVVTLDGAGDAEAGLIATGDAEGLRVIQTVPTRSSLGALYLWVTRFLGFQQFDEYKVMGLAALGEPTRLERELGMVRLLPRGRFEVDWKFALRLRDLARPRRRGEPIDAFHADLAAATQTALEETVLHVLRHARAETGLSRLCLSGGVAHNCAMTGTVAATEQFEEIFVHPASHDAGCAVGAALWMDGVLCTGSGAPARASVRRTAALRSVSWGTRITVRELRRAADRWDGWIAVEGLADRTAWAAEHLAAGGLLPWVIGQAEFGPRALGNRSLLADPRDAAMRDRINAVVKKREAFRPFAPVVRAEDASRYFDISPGIDCSFMSFAVPVRPEAVALLPAVTHADGTARLQTVERSQHRELWELLGAFGERAGPAVLLNTSLNVAGEPIVDGIDDVVDLLLATGISHAVVGDFLLTRLPGDVGGLAPRIHPDVRVVCEPALADGTRNWRVERGGPLRWSAHVSPATAQILHTGDGSVPLTELAAGVCPGDRAVARACVDEVLYLWHRRVLRLVPPRVDGHRR